MTAMLARVGLGLMLVDAAIFNAPAHAQTAGEQEATSLTTLTGRLPVGATVFVTDANARRIKGELIDVNAAGVRVQSGNQVHHVGGAEVRLVEWQRPDSPWNGALLGAGIGAIPGIYWLITDPNECAGLCPEELALVGIGAAVGGFIDHVLSKRVTVFRWAGNRASSLAVTPWAWKDGRGVQLAVRF